MAEDGKIHIKGAKVNNLKDITVEIPRNRFVVVTGVSGSGKSSLAFDTLFAEGQRRFAESLSSYARQFLGRMNKPNVEAIEGIPPAIAIEQKVNTKNPRSTVATTTEIYDYLRIIFARIGRTYSPISGKEVKCHSANDVMASILKGDAGTIYILADVDWNSREDKVELMLRLKEEGYTRFFADGKTVRIEDVMRKAGSEEYPVNLFLMVDRLKLPVFKSCFPFTDEGKKWSKTDWEDLQTRLLSSIETAFRAGKGRMVLRKENLVQPSHPSLESSEAYSSGIPASPSDKTALSADTDAETNAPVPSATTADTALSAGTPATTAATTPATTAAPVLSATTAAPVPSATTAAPVPSATTADTALSAGTPATTAAATLPAAGFAEETYSERFELDGITFRESDEYLFSFNSPLGACPVCGGLGKIIGVSEDLVVPDKTLSIYDGAIACWRGEKMAWFKDQLIKVAESYGIPIFKPYCELTQEQKDILWDTRSIEGDHSTFVGINEFFEWVESNRYKIQFKYMLSRFSGRTTCHTCHGTRLRKEALYVKVGGKTIAELLNLNVDRLLDFFEKLSLSDYEASIVSKAVEEVVSRLRYIREVGLSYLTLNRNCNTLSGGESQRINLVTALGSSLVGSLYILDEPSIGLHPRDTSRLIAVLKRLRDIGNTVVVVEHDEEIIRAADLLIDIGPLAGSEGGRIVFTGKLPPSAKTASDAPGSGKMVCEYAVRHNPTASSEAHTAAAGEKERKEETLHSPSLQHNGAAEEPLTLQYLTGSRQRYRREKHPWTYSITVEGAMEHNLKCIDAVFPLGVLTAVTGVSGSGKSSLVGDILYPALFRRINQTGDLPGVFKGLKGNLDRITRIEYVDQNPIGKSSRSNAVTYLKIYDDIRKIFSEQQYAKINGYTPSFFSFNQEGGRCPECQGEGFVKIPMQFMADVTMLCEACGGKRFKPDILEVRYKGKNIDDVLGMSVEEAISFFGSQSDAAAKTVAKRLKPLVDVGLSYIKLGQSSSTLSGGESQRVKLAYYLSKCSDSESGRKERILFVFDEPTTGLHFYDVEKLLKAFDLLIAAGHTVIVVEHNLDVIRAADWVIDLGPEAGDDGGEIIFTGTPEDLAANGQTHTAKYLRDSSAQ